jgi:hypothetical protein
MIIFLSYASEQRDIAEEIKLALAAGENIGWSCNDCRPSNFMLTKLTYLAHMSLPAYPQSALSDILALDDFRTG